MNPRLENFFLLVMVAAELSGPASAFSKCPPLKLGNGRSRYGWRGRSVRFNCMRPFQLVGAKYATCMNGKWDADAPICVRYGCRVPSTTHVNGQFIESYRGAVVKIVCNPGYSLVGSPSVYCNGVKWNETFPVCRVKNTSPALACDFENPDLCGWSQDPMHDFDWKRRNGSTGAEDGEAKPPRFDHTKGENGTGFYMHIESWSRRAENDTGRLYSPVYPAGYSNDTCFKFWYQINGPTIGFLKVYVKPEGVELNNLIPSMWINDAQTTWKEGFFQIEPLETPFQIVIEGVRVYGEVGDTAFDDVQLTTGDECKVLEEMNFSTEIITSVAQDEDQPSIDPGSCKDRCFKDMSNGTWEMEVCGCNETCEGAGICCPDYSDLCSTVVSTQLTETKMYSVSSSPETDVSDVRIPSMKPAPESPTTPSTKPTTKPPTKPTTQPTTKATTKLPTKPATQPTTKATTKPPTKPTPPADNNNESNDIDPRRPLGHFPNGVPQRQPPTTTTPRPQPRHPVPIPKNETFQKPPPVLEKKPGREKPRLGNGTTEEEVPRTRTEGKAKGKAEVKPQQKPKEKAVVKPQEKEKAKPEEKGKTTPEVESTKATPTGKVSRSRKPSRVKLQNTILEDSSNTDLSNEFMFRMGKPKEVPGKEPPQAIKIEGENESANKIASGLVQFGISLIAILIFVIFAVFWYKRREQRKTERESMVEDSDVRFLTSDEALDFTLAKPADDDL